MKKQITKETQSHFAFNPDYLLLKRMLQLIINMFELVSFQSKKTDTGRDFVKLFSAEFKIRDKIIAHHINFIYYKKMPIYLSGELQLYRKSRPFLTRALTAHEILPNKGCKVQNWERP